MNAPGQLQARLAEPWAGALLRTFVDPLEWADPAALALPGGLDATAVLSAAAPRRCLTRTLCDVSAAAFAEIERAAAEPNARLALMPAPDANALMALSTAWLYAPDLAAMIRTAEVRKAREALGDAAFAFATGRARTMPRPSTVLLDGIGLTEPRIDLDRLHAWTAGAALLGRAIGPIPDVLRKRMQLRRPQAAWEVVCERVSNPQPLPSALAAIRRLLRDTGSPWSTWLS